MLAVRKVRPGPGGVEVQAVPEPGPGPGEVLIAVEAAGLCGTDMQIWRWAPRMARRMALPRTLGHEVCGRVVDCGAGVSRRRPGERVVLESHLFCGECTRCRRGAAHLCERLAYPGIDFDGGFAERVTVPASIAIPVPEALPPTLATMLEPFGIAVHASRAGGGVAGARVLVNGCGPIGLMNVAVARALGAHRVVAVDPNPVRLAEARRLGADLAMAPPGMAPGAEERAPEGERGADSLRPEGPEEGDALPEEAFDVVIEYSGTPRGFDAAARAVARGGELRLVGGPPEPHPVDFTRWLARGITLRAIHGRRLFEDWEAAFDLMERLGPEIAPLGAPVLSLADALEGFLAIEAGRALKPLLLPGPGPEGGAPP